MSTNWGDQRKQHHAAAADQTNMPGPSGLQANNNHNSNNTWTTPATQHSTAIDINRAGTSGRATARGNSYEDADENSDDDDDDDDDDYDGRHEEVIVELPLASRW